MSTKHTYDLAAEWIRTDRDAVIADIRRLGLDAAVEYQMDLISDRAASGDVRWNGITEDDIRSAIAKACGQAEGKGSAR